MFPGSRTIDRYEASVDHDGLIANAGLIVIATLMSRLGLEGHANQWVHNGSFAPGRKICTLIAAMVAGATHIDHTDPTSRTPPNRHQTPFTTPPHGLAPQPDTSSRAQTNTDRPTSQTVDSG